MKRCVDCFHHNACKSWRQTWAPEDLEFPYECKDTEHICDDECFNIPVRFIPSDCKTFIDGVKPEDDYFTILNWYRNLNYKEGNNTERGIMSAAINELFMDLKNRKAEDKFAKD